MRPLPLALAIALIATPAVCQQFLNKVMPGAQVWTESGAPFDADEDGDLDLILVHANGWSMPGDLGASSDPLPPTLLRNDGTDGQGYPIWTDQSAAFLPAGLVFHGRSIAVADVDADGHEDLVISTAFGDQPRLLRKNPANGRFEDETAARLPVMLLNSPSVSAGDVDDDGDLDLVLADAGPVTFAAPGGKARLLLNDGTGVFTEAAAQLPAIEKLGAQNAKLLDMDNDTDLDVVVDGKSPVTQLYLNDGAGHFTLDLSTIPSSNQSGSISTYETEFADLDGDSDFDAVIMNTNWNMKDSVARNQLAETGLLRFSPADPTVLDGPNAHDENDFAFLDSDDDGDLDLVVGCLPFSVLESPTNEKLFINSGSIGPGSFAHVPGEAFDVGPDATLDLVIADYDGNGTYDIVSLQGEYLPYRNLYYKNVGPADTQPPVFLALSETPATLPVTELAGGWPRRAVVQESVMDEGNSFVEAELHVDVDKDGDGSSATLPMAYVGGYVFRGEIDPAPTATGLVGADVAWSVTASDPMGNSATSATASVRLCGTETYGAPSGGPALGAVGLPVVGQSFTLTASGGPASGTATLLIGLARADVTFQGATLLVDPGFLWTVDLPLDGTGSVAFPAAVPDDASFAGIGVVMQLGTFAGGAAFGNGLEVVICGG